MHAGLLPRADPDRLSIEDITNRVGLGELECDPGNEHISPGRFWKLFALCDNIGKIIPRHRTVIAALLQAQPIDLTYLRDLRLIGRVDLHYRIFALFLFL